MIDGIHHGLGHGIVPEGAASLTLFVHGCLRVQETWRRRFEMSIMCIQAASEMRVPER
jgi:hypothetical protein